jgi:uncharacterized HAD superfamily protein
MASGEWDHYHSLSVDDKPAKVIIDLVIALHCARHEIYIVTARPRKWLRQTYRWLHNNGILIDESHILMREYDDFQPSHETKLTLTSHLNIDLLIEDREDVCLAFAKAGIPSLMVRLVS